MYYEEATAEGVRPEVAFAQAMKETGWLQYGGDMQITQYNFAGIGTDGRRRTGEFLPGCQNRDPGTDPASESLCDRRSTCRGMCR